MTRSLRSYECYNLFSIEKNKLKIFMILLITMTEEQKEQIRAGVAQVSKQMYDAMISSYEMVEKDLPSSLSEDQKREVFTALFNSCFDTQKRLLEATMSDVKTKIKDQDLMMQMSREVHNARNEARDK